MGNHMLALLLQLSSPLVAASPVASVDGPAFAAAMVGRDIELTLNDKRVVVGTLVSRAADGYVLAGDGGVVVTVSDGDIAGIRVEPPIAAVNALRDRVAALEVRPETVVAAPKEKQTKALVLAAGSSPILGTKKAPIVITVFGSLQCPFTARLMPWMRALLEDPRFKGRTQIVFKHRPITKQVESRAAAEAAEAARGLGGDVAFFAMADKAFGHQDALTASNFMLWATEIGLDASAFEQKLVTNAATAEATIAADIKLAETVNVRGTPTVFVNGWELERRTADSIDALIKDKKLKR